MADQKERTAQRVVEGLIDMQLAAERLGKHSTVRSNKALRADVEQIDRAAKDAAVLTCRLWFKSDSTGDLPDAA